MRFGAHRNNIPTQFRVLRQRYTRAEAEKEFPQSPMGIDPKERFTKGDKAGNVQDRLRRELMKLHAINKKSPRRNSWAGRENPRKRKARNITRWPLRGLGMHSVLGKMT
jgi:hypothetical protein